jgi:putative Mg2+ transporter-C (MgtC) family protein
MNAIWQEIRTGIQTDFSDLPGIAEVTQVVVRLLLAALLGGLLGFQREREGKEAGLRTHMLVALGAAFFTLIPYQAGMLLTDMSRVLQGIIAGVGFLGAGTILKQNEAGRFTTDDGGWSLAHCGWVLRQVWDEKRRLFWPQFWPSSSLPFCHVRVAKRHRRLNSG